MWIKRSLAAIVDATEDKSNDNWTIKDAITKYDLEVAKVTEAVQKEIAAS